MTMTHRSIIAALIAPLLMFGSPDAVRAQAIEACRGAVEAEARVAACSAIIAGAGFSEAQKATAYRNRGRSRVEAGAFASALDDLGEAIKRSPDDALAYGFRAQARMGSNDLDGAISDYGAIVRLKPTWSQGYIGRGHARLVKGDTQGAITDFTEALRISPASASARNNRGLAYKKAGDADRALEDYTAAITLNPIYALAYTNRGYVHEEQGRKDAAIADYRRALLIDPSMTGAKDGLARLGAFVALASESQQLVRDGKALVDANCRACHAVGATGASPNVKAPTFRSLHARHPMLTLREPLTRGIAAPHDEMPKFKLADTEIDRIVAYINSLKPTP